MTVDRNPPPVPSAAAESKPGTGKSFVGQFLLMFVVLAGTIFLLMPGCFAPDKVLFSNDGPLGRLMSECHQLPESFTGTWEDLNAAGYREQGALPDITCGLRLWLKPLWFAKLYVPIAMVILGLCAWLFFCQLGLAPPACILGGLAATLNSAFFSDACWGVAGHSLAVAMTFLAMAALAKTAGPRGWLRAALAGMAVGMGLAEGADFGALFSVCVAAYVCYQAWIAPGNRAQNLFVGVSRLAVVIAFAVFMAAYAISALFETQLRDVSGMQQDLETRDSRWNWATQWSLPVPETLSLVVPGLFGYRMDTPNGAKYWGSIGRDIEWSRYFAGGKNGPPPRGMIRHTGSGIYAGVTVVLIAVWATLQSFRRRDPVFGLAQRKWLWFWIALGLISLLLGFGRYAPFYRVIYALPFTSTVRNPVKFLAVVNLAIVVLFAWGVDGLWRKYVAIARIATASPWQALKGRWAARGVEKRWLAGCLAVLAMSLVTWVMYAASRESMVRYLEYVEQSATSAYEISFFSITRFGWFVLFFALAALLVGFIMSGVFSGPRAPRATFLLGVLLVLDLGHANAPWVVYWNYKEKYASNPVVDFLRQKPFEQRVVLTPFLNPNDAESELFRKIYLIEWAQHLFQYYNIQSSELVQLSRVPKDMEAFNGAFYYDGTSENIYRIFRRWELNNTRYLLGVAETLDSLNLKFDPIQQRFRTVFRFNIAATRPPTGSLQVDYYTTEMATNGKFAVFEFTGSLPRAKLFSNWQTNADEPATLNLLANPSFDPKQTLLVSGGLPANAAPDTNHDAGNVEITDYSSRAVRLKANATTPAVLLLNDKFDPTWQVSVDGRPAPMLRCNYLMRGVYLERGTHTVEFRFQPQARLLRVSVAAICVAGLLAAILGVVEVFQPAPVPNPPEPVRGAAAPPAAISPKAKPATSKSKV